LSKHFPLYLVYGSERFLIEQSRKKIIRENVKDRLDDVDFAVYDMSEVPIEEAIADAETLPFMSEKRIVIITNPTMLTSEKEKKIAHDVKRLEAYINHPSSDSVVIIEAPYEKLDERKKIVKLLKTHANVIQASSLNGASLTKWLKKEAAAIHLSITDQALEKMVQLLGTDLRRLHSELEKIQLYVGEGGEATEETVEQLVSRVLENNVFALVDHVVNRRKNQAFRTLFDLFEQNEEPIKMVALLAKQFRTIYQVKDLSKKGFSQKKIASQLKLHPYVVKLYHDQGKHFSESECLKLLKEIAEVDYTMKIGQMDKRLALELLFAKILA